MAEQKKKLKLVGNNIKMVGSKIYEVNGNKITKWFPWIETLRDNTGTITGYQPVFLSDWELPIDDFAMKKFPSDGVTHHNFYKIIKEFKLKDKVKQVK